MLKRYVILPFCALGIAACSGDEVTGGPDAGPVDSGEVPDNCTEATPCALQDGVRGSDYVSPVGDVDPWTFEVPAPGRVINLVLENDATISRVDLELGLFGPDGRAIDNERFQGNGRQRVELQLVAPAAGRYRVEVQDVGSDDADRLNPYYLTYSLFAESDENEPNDSAEAAVALADGQSASGTIGFQGDEDWFSFQIGANQLIQVEMSAPGVSDVRLRWSLYASDATTRLAQSDEPEGDAAWPVENRAVGNAAGTYYVKVEDIPEDGADADLSRFYQITVRAVAEPDAQEQAAPNDTPATATPVSDGQTLTGYIAATSDADYFAIDVPSAPSILRVHARTAAATPVDLVMTVLMPDGETLICDERDGDLCEAFRFQRDGTTGPADLLTAHLAEAPGTYYVRIADQQDNDFDTDVAYTLTVDLPPEPDANEDYSLSQGDAIPVTPTSTSGPVLQFPWVEGYISHARDIDWYRFDLPGPDSPDPEQNGDWLLHLELEMPSPTPVELQAFFYFPANRGREGYGQRCRRPAPDDPENCQYPPEQNGISLATGETQSTIGQGGRDNCFVVFRETTSEGPHYFRMSDLDFDDFDLTATGRYRLRLTATAGCPMTSVCYGIFEQGGADLCGRP